MWQSAAETAGLCGHSESVLFAHYREVVTPEAAAEYWSVLAVLPEWESWLAAAAAAADARRLSGLAGMWRKGPRGA